MKHVLALFGLILIGALTAPHAAVAQQRELMDLLQHAKRVECRFSRIATGDWDGGEAELTVAPVELEAAFFDIDVETGTAEAEGRFGASYIVVRYAEGYLHFMQTLNAGPVYLTTIFAEGTEAGRLKAVHTRHEYTEVALPGYTSRPEMYLGDCAVSRAED
jgi:hypothetical protein